MYNRSGFSFAGETNNGLVRRHNEDSFLIAAAPERSTALLVVADGVGGHRHGEIVSYISCRDLGAAYFESTDSELADPRAAREFLARAVAKINTRVFDRNYAERNLHPMSSTINVLLLIPGFAIMANAGDSRLYRMADGKVSRLSSDHTLAADRDYAFFRPKCDVPGCEHIISRSIGTRQELKVELKTFERTPGERFFLCTDGVYHDLPPEILEKLIRSGRSARDTVNQVVRAVLLAGADDNLTVLCAFPDPEPPQEHSSPQLRRTRKIIKSSDAVAEKIHDDAGFMGDSELRERP